MPNVTPKPKPKVSATPKLNRASTPIRVKNQPEPSPEPSTDGNIGNGENVALKLDLQFFGDKGKDKAGIIYKRTDVKTGKDYIGQTKSPERY